MKNKKSLTTEEGKIVHKNMKEKIMATWDQGGGCACGLNKTCECESTVNKKKHHDVVAEELKTNSASWESEGLVILDIPGEKQQPNIVREGFDAYRKGDYISDNQLLHIIRSLEIIKKETSSFGDVFHTAEHYAAHHLTDLRAFARARNLKII